MIWLVLLQASAPPPSAPPPPPELVACAGAAFTAPLVPLADRFGHVARACAELFHHPSCRTAWRTANDQPIYSRAAYLIDTCRAAYCPSLKPRPSLCDGELTPSRMLAESAGLVRAALVLDHGEAFASQAGLLISAPPPEAPAPASAGPKKKRSARKPVRPR